MVLFCFLTPVELRIGVDGKTKKQPLGESVVPMGAVATRTG